jgi:hypothetical protein
MEFSAAVFDQLPKTLLKLFLWYGHSFSTACVPHLPGCDVLGSAPSITVNVALILLMMFLVIFNKWIR